MIKTNKEIHIIVDLKYEESSIGGLWFNDTSCHNLRGPLFKELFVASREYIYYLRCGLYAYDKRQ